MLYMYAVLAVYNYICILFYIHMLYICSIYIAYVYIIYYICICMYNVQGRAMHAGCEGGCAVG